MPTAEKDLLEQLQRLKQKNELLEKEITELHLSRQVNQVLFRITSALNTAVDLNQLYDQIHSALNRVIPVPEFYIALFDKTSETVAFPYHSSTRNDADSRTATIKQTEMLIRDIVNTGRSLMLNRDDLEQKFQPAEESISFPPPAVWLGIPLKIRDEVIGVMVAQSYSDQNQYGKTDINLLHSVSNHIALAIERKKAEDTLRESEERLTMALEATSEGIWDWDIRNDHVYIDSRMFHVLGYPPDAFPNTFGQWQSRFHPEDYQLMHSRLIDHLKGKIELFECETRVRTYQGTWLWLLCRGKVVEKTGNNRAARVIGTFTDIATQKQALQALAESEERFRILQEASFGGIGIHEKGMILDANQSLSTLTGFPHDELIGMNGLMLIDESTREMVMHNIVTGYEKPYDAVGLRKDGSTYPLEIQGKNMPYHGRTVRVTEFRDITVRKKAEEALRESEERYRILSDVTLEGIIFHENAVAIDINNSFAAMFGYAPDEIIGKNYVDLLVAPAFRDIVYEGIAARRQVPLEINMVKKDGSVFPVEIEGRNVEYKNKSLRAASVRDISERKRTEERLIQLQKMEAIGTLAGGVAHDFNNLLGGILGNVSLLKMHLAPDTIAHKKVVTIEKIVQRGTNLARQLLGFARGGKYHVAPVNVNVLISDTLEMFGRTSKNIQIHTALQDDLWTIEGDRTQLEQVLLNLLINAADAMPEGGEIYLATKNMVISEMAANPQLGAPGNYATITVRDTGSGMDPETKSKVFDPFFTTKEQGKGTGLGLSSAYGIIKNHNGYIEVYSEPGHGSVFKITIPASGKKINTAGKTAYQLKTGAETILLVDDETDFRNAGNEMLQTMGYQTVTAENGKQAVDFFSAASDTIDLVILDMIMPKMGGGETFDLLRQIKPDIKVLLCSGYSADSEAANILSRGCNGFIQKPFDIIELSHKVREIIDAVDC